MVIGINVLADQTRESTPVFGSWFADAYDQPSIVFGFFVLGAGIGAGLDGLIEGWAKKNWEFDGFFEKYQETILEVDKRAFWSQTSAKRKSGV